MRTFMKFTLAVFVMLLAGAAGSRLKPIIHELQQAPTAAISTPRFRAGCRRLLNKSGYRNIQDMVNEMLADPIGTKNKYSTHVWNGGSVNGLEDLISSGCAWCAPGPSRPAGYGCDDFATELDLYIRFQKGAWTDEAGRIYRSNNFCKFTCAGKDCKKGADKGTCGDSTRAPWAGYGYQKLEVYGWAVPVWWQGRVYQDNEYCAKNQLTHNPDGHQTLACTCSQKNNFPKNGVWTSSPNVYDCGKKPRTYRTRFWTLDKADKCYSRGCQTEGYLSENEVSNLPAHLTAQLPRNEVRKTIDAKGPAPVNQSKGFDGYQTALIVGLCVASAFITAGSIYACRRLNEKAIELPVDVEDKIVIA